MLRPYAWLRHARIVARLGPFSTFWISFFRMGDDETNDHMGDVIVKDFGRFRS